jgi:hypothetical protein
MMAISISVCTCIHHRKPQGQTPIPP